MTTELEITEGSSWGALMYNINNLLGWSLMDPEMENIVLYSDLVSENYTYWDIMGSREKPTFAKNNNNSKFEQTAINALSYQNATYAKIISTEDYHKLFSKADGLFGFSFFPWNPTGLSQNGQYYLKYRRGKNTPIKVNPLRWEALLSKGETIIKLIILYYLVKWGIKFTYKKIKS